MVQPAHQRCAVDEDCTIVDVDCCSCRDDGARAGVNRAAQATIAERRDAKCSDYGCSTALSVDPTCCADDVRCLDEKCTLFGDPGRCDQQ